MSVLDFIVKNLPTLRGLNEEWITACNEEGLHFECGAYKFVIFNDEDNFVYKFEIRSVEDSHYCSLPRELELQKDIEASNFKRFFLPLEHVMDMVLPDHSVATIVKQRKCAIEPTESFCVSWDYIRDILDNCIDSYYNDDNDEISQEFQTMYDEFNRACESDDCSALLREWYHRYGSYLSEYTSTDDFIEFWFASYFDSTEDFFKFQEFLNVEDIYDLHEYNIGYIDYRPYIIDWG